MYADDTVILAHGNNTNEISDTLNAAMENIADWLSRNQLSLNVKKTMAILFSNRPTHSQPPLNLQVRGESIAVVHETKYLGITIDSQLKFDKHAELLAQKLKLTLFTFRHIRDSLSIEAAKTFFDALILSRINYCITTWSQCNANVTNPIASLYKRGLKTLDKKKWSDHHCPILQKYAMLPFDKLPTLAILTIVYKVHRNMAPEPIRDLFTKYAPLTQRTTRSQTRGDFVLPRKNTKIGQSGLAYQGAKLWNLLPSEIRDSASLRAYITDIKTLILNSSHCTH